MNGFVKRPQDTSMIKELVIGSNFEAFTICEFPIRRISNVKGFMVAIFLIFCAFHRSREIEFKSSDLRSYF